MQKVFSFFLVALIVLSLFGCTKQKTISQEEILQENVWPDVQNNDLFTDSFFSDIVEIGDTRIGRVSGSQMKPIIRYLKSLTLSETREYFISTKDENGELLLGPSALIFCKSDGTEIQFIKGDTAFSGTDANGEPITYVLKDGNLFEGLQEAFAIALSSNG